MSLFAGSSPFAVLGAPEKCPRGRARARAVLGAPGECPMGRTRAPPRLRAACGAPTAKCSSSLRLCCSFARLADACARPVVSINPLERRAIYPRLQRCVGQPTAESPQLSPRSMDGPWCGRIPSAPRVWCASHFPTRPRYKYIRGDRTDLTRVSPQALQCWTVPRLFLLSIGAPCACRPHSSAACSRTRGHRPT